VLTYERFLENLINYILDFKTRSMIE